MFILLNTFLKIIFYFMLAFISESSASICKFFQRGICYRDLSCPFRHTSGPKTVVCKHWLRGLCKKVG